MSKALYLNSLFKLFTAVIVLTSFNQVQARLQCGDLFRDTSANKQIINRTPESRKATTVEAFHSLKPSDLLTENFILELERAVGPVSIHFSSEATKLSDKLTSKIFKTQSQFSKDISSLSIVIKAGKESVVNFTLYFNKKTNYLAIDGLQVSNPMNTKIDHLHMSQSSKGAPVSEFNKAKASILGMIQKQGWDGVLCIGTTHYLVSMLYQRIVKMKPTVASEKYYGYLESIRKSFSSSDIFYEALGSVRPDMLMPQIEQVWASVRTPEEMIQKGFTPIYKDNQIVAATYIGGLSQQLPRTYIIDPFSDGRLFLHWSRMMSEGQTELILEFDQ